MKAGGSRVVTHVAAAVLGAALVCAVLSAGSRKGGMTEAEKAPAAGLATTGSGRGSRMEDSAEAKLSVADLRQMLTDSAAIPMLRYQHRLLQFQLFAEWGRQDPEGLLDWRAEHPWLEDSRFPSPSELALRKPEEIYQWALAHGDRGMMEHLLAVNPLVTLDLMRRAGVKPSARDMSQAFAGGVSSDPDFVKHLEDISDPALKREALDSVESSFNSSGRYAELAQLWRDHPERVRAESLAMTLGTDFADGLPNHISALLPSTTNAVDRADPFQVLGFIGQLQQAYLPQGGERDWTILTGSKDREEGKANFDYPALQAAARGERSPEILDAVAYWWLASTYHPQPEKVADPVLRDVLIEKILETNQIATMEFETEADVRQRLLGQITDEGLKQRLESQLAEKERENREDMESGKDPFAEEK